MDIRIALSDQSLLAECDKLVSKCISDQDRAAEIAQEIYLELLETPKRTDWTREKVIEVFSKHINAADCRLRRLYEHDRQHYLEPVANTKQSDIENLQLIRNLPDNLQQTAFLMYRGYTRAEVMTEQNISPSMYYRRRIAIQEILL